MDEFAHDIVTSRSVSTILNDLGDNCTMCEASLVMSAHMAETKRQLLELVDVCWLFALDRCDEQY